MSRQPGPGESGDAVSLSGVNGHEVHGNVEKEVGVATGGNVEVLQNVEKEVDVPPNGGYGWICVAACFTING